MTATGIERRRWLPLRSMHSVAGRASRRTFAIWSISIVAGALCSSSATAATPSDPEVRDVVAKALSYLEGRTDSRLGGKALIGLAFKKAANVGLCSASHPRIVEAHEACEQMADEAQLRESFIYSKGLAIIFLAEANGDRELMLRYSRMLADHQRAHGGFTYKNFPTGDTSQTQYAALAYWELLNHRSRPDADSAQRCLNWLMRTQDPRGLWGYQGHDPGSFELVEQYDEPGLSMAAAGMGSTLILGNMLGILVPPGEERVQQGDVPEVLKRADVGESQRAASLSKGDVDANRVKEAIARGRKWFDANFKPELTGYPLYYLYSVERYKSFEEYIDGVIIEQPEWYNQGFELLKERQAPEGSWSGSSGTPCATAFGVLFLLRSTQQSIRARLGEGTLVGGRGLPKDLSKLSVRGGKVIVEQQATDIRSLLDQLSGDDAPAELLIDTQNLLVQNVQPDDARRLQQIVRSGEPETRLLAVRALAALRDLDHVPTLIYGLTDPDRQVVLAARDGLRSVSRKIDGFGLPDDYDESQRARVVGLWKQWSLRIRPNSQLIP